MGGLSPPATPSMSQDSTLFGLDSSLIFDSPKSPRRRLFNRVQAVNTSRDILLFLLAFRVVNALSIKTFFQPDEYFQSLEPAWQIAFGRRSGAWVTWEWNNQLRSSLHPLLFAIVYRIAATLSWMLYLPPQWRADLLIAAPKIAQAVCASLGDFYTWRLGQRIFGEHSSEAWAVLLLTCLNPWQWFCSTRTLSNCLEATLTIVALNHWPWTWLDEKQDHTEDAAPEPQHQQDEEYVHVGEGSPRLSEASTMIQPREAETPSEEVPTCSVASLRVCLTCAALACILRPTNVLIWISLSFVLFLRSMNYGYFTETRWTDSPIWINYTTLAFLRTRKERTLFIREAIICGSAGLLLAFLVDISYYRKITFPPFRFLYFNLAQSLAVFYGSNRRDYYFTEGIPLLLTTYLPLGILGIYQSLSPPRYHPTFINSSPLALKIRHHLAKTSLVVPIILSLISHKEVRFIYPLLSIYHILIATPFTTYFLPAFSPTVPRRPLHLLKRFLLILMLALNLIIAIFATTSHQTAPLSVLSYLRHQHATLYLSQPPPRTLAPAPSTMTVGFLMPCHSTPWRSHLVFPTIKAWALGCEPPINLNASARATYVDEADQFYVAPQEFLARTLGTPPQPRKKGENKTSWWWPLDVLLGNHRRRKKSGFGREEMIEANAWDGKPGRKTWPEYLVFFQEKEALMREVARGSAYRECWRGWNSWVHDDWRRQGDIIVWCLRSQRKGRNRRWIGGWWW